MPMTSNDTIWTADGALEHARRAGACMPPAWPLSATVAVNPYLGQTGETLAVTSARLALAAGTRSTMPRAWYAAKIAKGEISDADLTAALEGAKGTTAPLTLETLKKRALEPDAIEKAVPTIADLARDFSGIDWPGLIEDRIGAWAATYFDVGQAMWTTHGWRTTFESWRAFAKRDLTPEIQGLSGFAAHVSDTPLIAGEAIARASTALSLGPDSVPLYFHRLLITLGGWAQLARQRSWAAEQEGEADDTLTDMLAARLIWEEALLERYGDALSDAWCDARARYAEPIEPSDTQIVDVILQQAWERSDQRWLSAKLAPTPVPNVSSGRPTLQAGFCIDVRSEVFRRALESVDSGIRTFGFAGFFGLPVRHHALGSDTEQDRLPVLLQPGLESRSSASVDEDLAARYLARAKRAWGRFKLAAVSSFAFVEAMGPVYVGRLFREALAIGRGRSKHEPMPKLAPAFDDATRVATAEKLLKAMSLTADFAPIVILAGHGANVTNNPFESALHCGACGGHSGDVNARLLAELLNDPNVRSGLSSRGIEIPDDTLFVGALHDTTTDELRMFDADHPSPAHSNHLKQVRAWLSAAQIKASTERALRLPHAIGGHRIKVRSRDWSEVRPEWGLAGCSAFIAAPRSRTANVTLDGHAFLHEYNWRADEGFGILELILTAPVVVASWISLQYYGSTVSPDVFGSGNKLLHNVTGGIGVVEGNGGRLRVGLPWQSVHDGEKFLHEPLRLSVCIEAPKEAIADILSKHEAVRELFDNQWLYLFAMDDSGKLAWRYKGDLAWEKETLTVDNLPASRVG